MLLTFAEHLDGDKQCTEGKEFIRFVVRPVVYLLLCSLICETPEGIKGKDNRTATSHHYSIPHAGYQPYRQEDNSEERQDRMNGNDTELTTWTMSSTSASASMEPDKSRKQARAIELQFNQLLDM